MVMDLDADVKHHIILAMVDTMAEDILTDMP